jgi:exopolysaccharide/PEP-CTERM locus tyrosine autokinase
MGKISDALGKAGHGERPESGSAANTTQLRRPEVERPAPVSQPVPQTEIPEVVTWDKRFAAAVNEDKYLPEIFKALRSRILYPDEHHKVPRTIMITSTVPQEGKSFISANLAVSLAQGMDQHSLLVSCDLRRPTLGKLFGIQERLGLVDYLRDKRDLSELIRKTSVAKLSLLPSGKPPSNPAELLGSSRMEALVEELSRRYEDRIVIFDSPPFQLAPESTVLKQLVDAVVLVVRQGKAGKHQVRKIVEAIGKDKLFGIVFNAHTTNIVERSMMKGYGSYYPTQGYNYK